MSEKTREEMEMVLYAGAMAMWGRGIFGLPFPLFMVALLAGAILLIVYQVERSRRTKRRVEVPLHLGPSHGALLTLLGLLLVVVVFGLVLALVALSTG